jgi:uncharacterized RDD family membrane protein YckC
MDQPASTQNLVFCSQCGRGVAQSDLVPIAGNWVCADCKPAFLSRVMAGGAAAASPLGWHYGGFWIRFGARFIDGLIFTVPMVIAFLLLMPGLFRAGQSPTPNPALFAFAFLPLIVVSFILGACYEILMLKYRSGTLGKMACGLKVVRPDGGNLSWGVCVGRFCMWNLVISGIPYLNSIFMLANSIILGVDEEKRGLHDRVCDTRVIYK